MRKERRKGEEEEEEEEKTDDHAAEKLAFDMTGNGEEEEEEETRPVASARNQRVVWGEKFYDKFPNTEIVMKKNE